MKNKIIQIISHTVYEGEGTVYVVLGLSEKGNTYRLNDDKWVLIAESPIKQ